MSERGDGSCQEKRRGFVSGRDACVKRKVNACVGRRKEGPEVEGTIIRMGEGNASLGREGMYMEVQGEAR